MDATLAIDAHLPAMIREFERRPELAVVYLFGSFARGTAKPGSDIDLGLVFRARGATALAHYWMIADLAARLEQVLAPHPPDLVVLEGQGPIFCHNVLLSARRLYDADPERRVDFESSTYVRAFDFRPTWEIATSDRVGRLRAWLRAGS